MEAKPSHKIARTVFYQFTHRKEKAFWGFSIREKGGLGWIIERILFFVFIGLIRIWLWLLPLLFLRKRRTARQDVVILPGYTRLTDGWLDGTG